MKFIMVDFMVNIKVCCHFAAVVLCCLSFLVIDSPYHSLFFFSDEILPCFVYSVIIIKMLLKHQITGLVILQMLLRNKLL